MIPNRDELYRHLDVEGVDTVAQRLASGVYDQQTAPLVQAWINSKRQNTSDQLQEQGVAIARSAQIAAWVAAIAAVISALAAIAAWLR
jgi:hypothetical protein